MKINIKQAVKLFFSNPSFELVFIEAIANSIDANADKIDINISIEEFAKHETLKVIIKDNGIGFTDERYQKFSELLKVEEDSHKGIGRLVFLSYFNTVDVISKYDNKQRTFLYSNNFKEEDSVVIETEEDIQETELVFNGYLLSKISTYDYLKPQLLINRIKEEFYPRLYKKKQIGEKLQINIILHVDNPDNRYDFHSDSKSLDIADLGELQVESVDASLIEMFKQMNIHYSITPIENAKTIITALCIDDRTYKLNIISDENIPLGYEIIFLLYSDLFTGQVDSSRQNLILKDNVLKPAIIIFRNKIAEILKREIPGITQNNEKTKEGLVDRYPHLIGYFEEETIGIIKREDTLKKAQEKFFKAQRDVLDAPNSISDEMYKKTLEMSSRALTEYILYRQLIIGKLRLINKTDDEDVLHSLIVPMRTKLHSTNFMSDLYSNNAWLLDDKYMTYNTILSDKVMSELIKEITKDEIVETDNREPDIALIFSNDPEKTAKVDVVIVELKKRGLKLEENSKAIIQLQQRATKLMQHYPDKIQRIWFYAIVEFNDEFKLYLENNDYIEIFSTDTVYYREYDIKTSLESTFKNKIGVYILSIDSFIDDADSRNSTFLKVLKDSFSKLNNEPNDDIPF